MEVLVYIAVVAIGYILWVKLKAFFTGRTWTEQVNHDDARKAQRVCRNCKHSWGTECLKRNLRIDPDSNYCSDFER